MLKVQRYISWSFIIYIFFYCLSSLSVFSHNQINKWAIIIAIDKYKDRNLLSLKYPEQDALKFKKLLIDYASFPEDNINMLIGKEATKSNIKKAIYEKLASKCSEEDEVFIFFSGYGTFIKDDNGDEKDGLDECIIPYDGKISDPNGNYIIDDELGNWLKAVKSRNVVLIFDAEKSSGMDDFIASRGGILLITSSDSNQLIREEDELKGGTFVHFFIEAIKKTKSDETFSISLLQAFDYARNRVISYTKAHSYTQTPCIKGKISREILFSTKHFLQEELKNLLVFTSDASGNRDIYLLSASKSINLTPEKGEDYNPLWSPDGGKIAFVSNRTGNFDIFIMDYDGKNQINLTNSPENNYMPSWSPDGSKLVCTGKYEGRENIFIINADGTGQKQITSGSWKDTKPLWSPDGDRLAFMSNRTGSNEIYTVNLEGSELVNLTNNSLEEKDFLWSGDGKMIAFTAKKEGQSDLYIMNSDGNMQINLTSDRGEEYDFSWSPDNSKIAYTKTEISDNIAQLIVIDIYGGIKSQLTFDEVWKRYPSWSPDGQKIAFSSGTKAPSSICVINIDGTGLLKLVGGIANNQEPAWCPVEFTGGKNE